MRETGGQPHLEARRAAGQILAGMPLVDFRRAIAGLRDVEDINQLISVGLKRPFMDALLDRAREAREERRPRA
tara:strand:- start:144 stop:362 length:219 start_codon:yes stop_codon:yes gene_type:complete